MFAGCRLNSNRKGSADWPSVGPSPAPTLKAPLGESSSDEDETKPSRKKPVKRSYWQQFVDYVINGFEVILILHYITGEQSYPNSELPVALSIVCRKNLFNSSRGRAGAVHNFLRGLNLRLVDNSESTTSTGSAHPLFDSTDSTTASSSRRPSDTTSAVPTMSFESFSSNRNSFQNSGINPLSPFTSVRDDQFKWPGIALSIHYCKCYELWIHFIVIQCLAFMYAQNRVCQ